jgi:hypothetical protein
MRTHHVIAVVTVILAGVAAPTAGADPLATKSMGLDVSRMHQNVKNLPVQELHDMSVVFSDRD